VPKPFESTRGGIDRDLSPLDERHLGAVGAPRAEVLLDPDPPPVAGIEVGALASVSLHGSPIAAGHALADQSQGRPRSAVVGSGSLRSQNRRVNWRAEVGSIPGSPFARSRSAAAMSAKRAAMPEGQRGIAIADRLSEARPDQCDRPGGGRKPASTMRGSAAGAFIAASRADQGSRRSKGTAARPQASLDCGRRGPPPRSVVPPDRESPIPARRAIPARCGRAEVGVRVAGIPGQRPRT
jgi:hypothetical protein